jgi:hypothetical protein
VATLEAGGFDEELVADGALEVGLAQFDYCFTLEKYQLLIKQLRNCIS